MVQTLLGLLRGPFFILINSKLILPNYMLIANLWLNILSVSLKVGEVLIADVLPRLNDVGLEDVVVGQKQGAQQPGLGVHLGQPGRHTAHEPYQYFRVWKERVNFLLSLSLFKSINNKIVKDFENSLKLKCLIWKKQQHLPLELSTFFWFIACTVKRLSFRLFRFKIDQFVPFCIFSIDFADFIAKKDKLINFKSK